MLNAKNETLREFEKDIHQFGKIIFIFETERAHIHTWGVRGRGRESLKQSPR